ncbi:DUF4157 domain-containing protein [Streptomyces sp. NPDC016172]|uniref:eCIS core domain-containing protein n=1 Tax=Streptomyces sp. NPDC016172 TaxID=3364964 RepID=UPI0036FEB857
MQDQGNHAVRAFLRREAGRAEPLPPSLRSGMESYFGRDLSGVRLHVSGDAARSASAQRARAYTVDQDICTAGGSASQQAWAKASAQYKLINNHRDDQAPVAARLTALTETELRSAGVPMPHR